ncbi:hypothetical protein HAP94_18730 [Acidithiobacillus ferrivorans]|nr:hypothetical protein [Acidithiobacillus ferrivorans]
MFYFILVFFVMPLVGLYAYFFIDGCNLFTAVLIAISTTLYSTFMVSIVCTGEHGADRDI